MSNLKAILATTISRIMTDMFFLFADEEPSSMAANTDWFEMSLTAPDGSMVHFCFRFDPELGKTMTENFIGVERPEISTEMATGTMQEFVNMVVGNIVNEVEGGEHYIMGLPQRIESRPEWTSPEPVVRLFFEEKGLEVWMEENQ